MHPYDAELLAFQLGLRHKTMCCAESCTGGLIGAAMTDMAGSSEYFLGSAVTYSNEAKMRILGVEEDTLIAHGAVSEETAREMALGAARVFGADYSVAVTGIAGPGGATETKPVGLVYIAVSDGSRTVVSLIHSSGTSICTIASDAASTALMFMSTIFCPLLP